MESVRAADSLNGYSKFERESLLYSRNLAAKFHHLCQAVDKISNRLDLIDTKLAEVTITTNKLGQACGNAFLQTKKVIQHLHEEQSHTREELSEYGGHLVEDSWDIGSRSKVV